MDGPTRCQKLGMPFGGTAEDAKEVCREIPKPTAANGGLLFMHEVTETLEAVFNSLTLVNQHLALSQEPICNFCPALSADIRIMEYWSENHLLGVMHTPPCFTSRFIESFPALSIGGNGTGTGVRQAHLGAASWLAMMAGERKIVVWAPRQASKLHAKGCTSPGNTNINLCKQIPVNWFDPKEKH